jgi:DNA-binding response OmpR family regulator
MADGDTIMVVEDDDATREFLADNLLADSYVVVTASSGRQALNLLEVKQCDLLLLDVMLPDASGFELCRRLRTADGIAQRIDPDMPVIMLSGRTSETDRVRGFARGADDYVPKPFHYPELAARIGAVLRRSRGRRERGIIKLGELSIDPASRDVRMDGRKVELSAKEFALLHALAADPVRVFTKEELLRDVWGFQLMGSTRTLDSHASRVRRKLAPVSGGRRWIVNVWGVGYRLTDPDS